MADSPWRSWLRRLLPERRGAAPVETPPTPAEREVKAAEDAVRGLRVDPRARYLDESDVERSPSGPGFDRLRVGGLPHWVDAIAKRRPAGDVADAPGTLVEADFDAAALLSASEQTRLALGPSVRRALVEALDHAPAVRLGEGFVEAIVPHEKAGQRPVQDAVLTIARAFTGAPEPLDRILRWAIEDESPLLRKACLVWLVRNGSHTPRTWDVLRLSLTNETDDAIRLEAAAALGGGARDVIEQIAERPNTQPNLRARAMAMLPSVCDDEARLDRLLLGGVRSGPAEVRDAALDTIAAAGRTKLVAALVPFLHHGKPVADALIRLGEPRAAFLALESAKRGEEVSLSLERIRIAFELGGKEVIEPLRAFLTAGNPRELATPTRAAIEKVKSRLVTADGALSIAASDDRGRLSPASRGGELSDAPADGALSEADPKRRR